MGWDGRARENDTCRREERTSRRGKDEVGVGGWGDGVKPRITRGQFNLFVHVCALPYCTAVEWSPR